MIELSRNITFGQYINNGSQLVRMDPRTKLLCATLLITALTIVSSFTAFAIFFIFCVILQLVSRISTLYVLRSYKPFALFLVFVFFLQILFFARPKTIYWQWWVLTISQEGIITTTQLMIRVLLLYYLVSMLMFSTSMVDLTNGLEALLSPLQKIHIPANAFIMVLVIAMKFVPIFVAEIERLVKAQTARGVRFDQGNFFQRIQKMAPLFIPIFVSGFKRAETLTIAMEARCYGVRPGWRRSKRRVLRFERFDALSLVFSLIFSAAMLIAYFTLPF